MARQDLGKLEDDMGSIESLRAKRSKASAARRPMGAAPMRPVAPVARPNPADAGVFTADKGIPPPSPDEGPTMDRGIGAAPVRPRNPMQDRAAAAMRTSMAGGMKKGGSVKKMKSGGSTGSASKRADGCATKGKTKGRMI